MTTPQKLTLEDITARAEDEQISPVNFKQVKLTKKYLLPRIKELHNDMLLLRQQYDQSFDVSLNKGGKSYPEGFCQEITLGVKSLLEQKVGSATSPGLVAIRDFVRNGGLAKRVWGNLRNQYFQNAFQFGSLYVDVSNDTVDIRKDKVEILPLSKARMFPINDYDGYADLAEKYWKGQVYPNRVLPDLAVMFPLFLIAPDGNIGLHANYQTILYRNMQHDFALSEKFLFRNKRKALELPTPYHEKLVAECGACVTPASDAELHSYFDNARETSLRFDVTRCQGMLDCAIAI